MTLTLFFETVYTPHRLRGKSQNSIRLYRLCIRQFDKTLGRQSNLSDLTETNVLKHLARRSNVAPATRNKELAELKAMWRLAAQRGLHQGWPSIQDEPEPQRTPIAWMPEELAKLLDSAARVPGDIDGLPAFLWWSGLIRLTLDTGERIGAMLAAQWPWIQGDWIHVPAESRKGKIRDRQYRISATTKQVLDNLQLRSSGQVIFPWTLDKNYLWKRYADLLKSAGLPDDRKHKFHALRKTTASVAYAAGLDAQDVLDHSDRRTTQAYLDPRFTRSRQACDVMADFLQNPTGEIRGTG